LSSARQSRDISREAYLRELQRYNVLDRSFDVDSDGELLRDEQSLAGLSTQVLVEEDEDESI
jgi:hypothetical protein